MVKKLLIGVVALIAAGAAVAGGFCAAVQCAHLYPAVAATQKQTARLVSRHKALVPCTISHRVAGAAGRHPAGRHSAGRHPPCRRFARMACSYILCDS